ncbi:MAG: Uncharacterised protein [Cellulomonadaceae bacterium TMED98]|nr:MAG: Uncharacterised protein [Cellulomonadaceae bacterium TMED98]
MFNTDGHQVGDRQLFTGFDDDRVTVNKRFVKQTGCTIPLPHRRHIVVGGGFTEVGDELGNVLPHARRDFSRVGGVFEVLLRGSESRVGCLRVGSSEQHRTCHGVVLVNRRPEVAVVCRAVVPDVVPHPSITGVFPERHDEGKHAGGSQQALEGRGHVQVMGPEGANVAHLVGNIRVEHRQIACPVLWD